MNRTTSISYFAHTHTRHIPHRVINGCWHWSGKASPLQSSYNVCNYADGGVKRNTIDAECVSVSVSDKGPKERCGSSPTARSCEINVCVLVELMSTAGDRAADTIHPSIHLVAFNWEQGWGGFLLVCLDWCPYLSYCTLFKLKGRLWWLRQLGKLQWSSGSTNNHMSVCHRTQDIFSPYQHW